MDKEDYDSHIKDMITNLVGDQTSYNINFRKSFCNIRDTHSYLKEELEEIKEAFEQLQDEERKVWHMIRDDKNLDEILFRLEMIEYLATEVIIEALHTAAVARKGIIQLDKEKAPEGGNPN